MKLIKIFTSTQFVVTLIIFLIIWRIGYEFAYPYEIHELSNKEIQEEINSSFIKEKDVVKILYSKYIGEAMGQGVFDSKGIIIELNQDGIDKLLVAFNNAHGKSGALNNKDNYRNGYLRCFDDNRLKEMGLDKNKDSNMIALFSDFDKHIDKNDSNYYQFNFHFSYGYFVNKEKRIAYICNFESK